jgi:hypothetical protein
MKKKYPLLTNVYAVLCGLKLQVQRIACKFQVQNEQHTNRIIHDKTELQCHTLYAYECNEMVYNVEDAT